MQLIKFLKNKYVLNIFMIGMIMFSYFILDLGFRYLYNDKVYLLYWNNGAPNLFTISFIIFIATIIYFIPRKIGRIVYLITYLIFTLFLVAQFLHSEILGRFFGFSDLFNASEGSDYFLTSLKFLEFKIIFLVVVSLSIMIISFILLNKIEKITFKLRYKIPIIISLFVLAFLVRVGADYKLGPRSQYVYDASTTYRNIYEDYADQTKSYFISGTYEYFFRTIYIYYKNIITFDHKEAHNKLDDYFKENPKVKETNKYTGYFEDKNIIFIMLESIDDWLVNEKTMPTLYRMQEEGINFKNRFAPPIGTGYTLNTEFALNTGLYSPNDGQIYKFSSNKFINSLAKLFKEKDYEVNSMHANDGTYYNRTAMHLSYGYQYHYALKDMGGDAKYRDDSLLITDNRIYSNIIDRNNKFLTFITTYSPHLPYNTKDNFLCSKELAEKEEYKVEGNEELTCLNVLAGMTDDMLKFLLKRLEEDNLIDDTVIVLASDHYLYGYPDKDYVHDKKGTSNLNMANKVPFIIWSNDKIKEVNETPMGTIDILPTLVNMFNLDYDPTYFLGDDVYSKNHPKYVYFSDNSWYDGKKYYDSFQNLNDEELEIYLAIKEKLVANDLILKSDYFNYLKSK